jgi:hypothetical protein
VGATEARNRESSPVVQPDVAAAAVRAEAQGAPYRVAVTVCKECRRGVQHGGGAVERMTPAAVDRAMCDAQWIGDIDNEVVERARQEIPPATRRKVIHRAQACCQAPGCRSHANLDVHHIIHREHGGTNDLSNLIVLCEAHHLAHHDGTLGIELVDGKVVFSYEGRNKFTRVSREVATKKALRERGFDRDQIRTVMARVINHIGTTDLPESQWLAIALRYAKQPSS